MSELTLNPVVSLAVSPSVATEQAQARNVASINATKPEKTETEQVKVETGQIQEAVSRINEYVQQSERRLDFRLDEASGQAVIRVYDKNSEELIRQIPGELALKIAEYLNDEEPTLLFRAQV